MPREAQPEELKREYEELQKKYDDLLISYELLQKDYDEFLTDQKNIFKVSRERELLKNKVAELKDELKKFRGLEDMEKLFTRGFISVDQGIAKLLTIRGYTDELLSINRGKNLVNDIFREIAILARIKESLLKANNE